MTQLILTHPPLSPTWTDSQIALHIVQMLFIFFTLIRQCVCAGAVCGRPSLQRNIWNGSKVYEVAAVNPVDVPQLFFSIQKEWPQLLDVHSQSLYFLLHVVMKELFWLFLFWFVIVKSSLCLYVHCCMNQSRVWLSSDFHAVD